MKSNDQAPGADSCPHCSLCRPFFNYAQNISRELGSALKHLYCFKHYSKCARFYIIERLDSEHMAADLPHDVYPNQEIRAHSIVNEAESRYS